MQELELIQHFTQPLDRLKLPYMVTGSIAGVLYGEPRLTHDVDIVLLLRRHDAAALAAAFSPREFYVPPEEVMVVEAGRDAHGHFNIIHHASGFKADIYLVGADPLHPWGLQRRRTMVLGGTSVSVAPVEYVILRKLQFFAEGGSQKHLRDIRGMLEQDASLASNTDIQQWVARLRLEESWNTAREPLPS